HHVPRRHRPIVAHSDARAVENAVWPLDIDARRLGERLARHRNRRARSDRQPSALTRPEASIDRHVRGTDQRRASGRHGLGPQAQRAGEAEEADRKKPDTTEPALSGATELEHAPSLVAHGRSRQRALAVSLYLTRRIGLT